jgi:hypothetical protein
MKNTIVATTVLFWAQFAFASDPISCLKAATSPTVLAAAEAGVQADGGISDAEAVALKLEGLAIDDCAKAASDFDSIGCLLSAIGDPAVLAASKAAYRAERYRDDVVDQVIASDAGRLCGGGQ